MKDAKLARSYSDKYLRGSGDYDLYENKNVEWMSGRFTKVTYLLFIFVTWFVIHISRIFPSTQAWTVTNIFHGVVPHYS